MTKTDVAECLSLFGTYRGQRADPLEIAEFSRLYATADRPTVEAAIRSAAERDGKVFLETVARRFGEIRDAAARADAAATEAARRAALPRANHTKPGWPCEDGSPVGNYLRWIAVRAMLDENAARATAAKYVQAGLVLPELADRVIAASVEARSLAPIDRSRAVGAEVVQIEREIGHPWIATEASRYVEAVNATTRGAAA